MIIKIDANKAQAPIPSVVTMRQARLALLAAGLLDDIEAFIASQPRAVQIEWEYATEVKRSNAIVASAQAAIGLTNEQVDNLFIKAAALLPQ